MKKSEEIEMINDYVEFVKEQVDEFIKENIKPIADVGSPEKLIGKKYEEWTDFDKRLLYQVYGERLDKFIFDKELDIVNSLREEE
jgi:Txe/YoeB family toxin of Txe-Axe toxin-antitoxin module